jgi:hypothetical protein
VLNISALLSINKNYIFLITDVAHCKTNRMESFFFPKHFMKLYKEYISTDVLILCLVTRCICVVKGSLCFVYGERVPFAQWIREWMCPPSRYFFVGGGGRKIYGNCWRHNYDFFIVRPLDVICVNMCNDTYTPFYTLPTASVRRLIWLMKINLFLDVTHSTRSLENALQSVALLAATQLQNYTVKLCCSVLQ